MIQLKSKAQIDAHRKLLAAKQKYQCPICKGSLAHGIQALDHCHKTGHVRAALCQSCNVGEGKVLAGMLFRTPIGNLAYKDKRQWLLNLIAYWDWHEANPSGVIHDTFDLMKGKQKPVARKGTVKKATRAKPKTKPKPKPSYSAKVF